MIDFVIVSGNDKYILSKDASMADVLLAKIPKVDLSIGISAMLFLIFEFKYLYQHHLSVHHYLQWQ